MGWRVVESNGEPHHLGTDYNVVVFLAKLLQLRWNLFSHFFTLFIYFLINLFLPTKRYWFIQKISLHDGTQRTNTIACKWSSIFDYIWVYHTLVKVCSLFFWYFSLILFYFFPSYTWFTIIYYNINSSS